MAKCESQKDVFDMLKELAEEFHDGTFNLPPLPDIEPVKLEIDEDGELKHAESGLSTKTTPTATGAREVAAVLGSSRHGGLGKVIEITATLGHAGLNWTPKRHATVSPPLAERIKTTLLCSVADRKKPHAEKTLALLPNRILIHNVMSFLADVHTTRINDRLLVENSPPNGTYTVGHFRTRWGAFFRPMGSSLIGFMAHSIELHIPVSLDVTLKPDWLDVFGDEETLELLATAAPSASSSRRSCRRWRARATTPARTSRRSYSPRSWPVHPWAGPTTPPAKLSQAAPHLAILEAARPSATAPMHHLAEGDGVHAAALPAPRLGVDDRQGGRHVQRGRRRRVPHHRI